MSPDDLTHADGVADAADLQLAGHPFRALHRVLPIALATTHPSVRRFALGLVEALVVRQETYPLPSQRIFDSFERIWRRYRAEAEAVGDREVAALTDRALSAMRVYDESTPPTGMSLVWVTASLEASEFKYALQLASRLLRGDDVLSDALLFADTTPIPEAREAARTLIDVHARIHQT